MHKAERALAAGDRDKARKLAGIFVERWESADDRPPAFARMSAILSTK